MESRNASRSNEEQPSRRDHLKNANKASPTLQDEIQHRKLTVLELLSGMNDAEVHEIRDILNLRCSKESSGLIKPDTSRPRELTSSSEPPWVKNNANNSVGFLKPNEGQSPAYNQSNHSPRASPNIGNKCPHLLDTKPASGPDPGSPFVELRHPVKMKRKQSDDEHENFEKLCEVVRPVVSLNVLRNLASPDDVRVHINKLKKMFGVPAQNKSITDVSYWSEVKDEDKMNVFLKAFASSLDAQQVKGVISGTCSEDEPVKKKKKKKPVKPAEKSSVNNKMPDDVYAQYRKMISIRKQLCLSRPKLRLTPLGEKSSLTVPDGSRVPLALSQVQHLVLYAILRDRSPSHCPPSFELRKPGNIKRTLFLVIDGVSLRDYLGNREVLKHLSALPLQLEVAMPSRSGQPHDDDCEDALTDISTLPLTEGEVKRLNSKYGSLEKAMQLLESLLLLRSIFPIKMKEKKNEDEADQDVKSNQDKFPRTELLLSPWQMVEHGYPVSTDKRFVHFKYTKDRYRPVTAQSPMWALDCEMCATRAGQELTRVSIINEQMEVLYDSLVKPPNPIINYLTQYSGITPAMMRNVTTTLEIVQEDIRRLIPPDCILVGHSLNCDLIALKMMHPYIIDTSVVFNLSGAARIKSKLKVLSAELLSERIQDCGRNGHDPTEDAAACMTLVLTKLSKSIRWGNALLGGQRTQEEIVAAQTLLLERDKEAKPKKELKIAKGAIVRKPSDSPASTGDVSSTYKQPPPNLAVSPTHDVAWFFFQPLIQRQTPCLIVGGQRVIDHFSSITPPARKSSLSFQTVEESAELVVTAGRDEAPSLGLSLMYVSLAECDVVEERVKNLNGLVKKVKKKMDSGVLLVVLLAGRRTGIDVCREGAAFFHLPLEEIPPVSMSNEQST